VKRSSDSIDLGLNLVQPQNLDAERAVLGGVLGDNEALGAVLGILQPADFYREAHRKIFSAMLDLNEQRKPIDLITLSDTLKAGDNLDAVGGSSYLAALQESTPTAANIRHHAGIVKRCADLRRQIEIFREGLELAATTNDDPAIVASAIASKLMSFQSTQTTGFVRIDELVRRGLKRIETAYENNTPILGIPTGLNVVEKQCGAIRKGHLVVVGGRTSTGKTSLALCIARNAATGGCPSAFISAESPLDEITVRLLSQVSGVENSRLQYGLLRDADIRRVVDSAARLSDLPLWFLGGVQKWELIKAVVRGLKARHPDLGLVAIDYAQLLQATATEKKRYLEVSKISAESKALALELDIAVFLLSQLSREPEKNHDRPPKLSDLRESGSLEQDCDICFLLYHDKNRQDESLVYLSVAKMRDGRTDVIPMRFDKKTVTFTEWVEG
jgi:replicative DNA helicase